MLLDMDQVRDVDPPHDINIDKFCSKIAAMYKSKAQDLVNWDNIETAKIRKPPYEMEAPSFYADKEARDNYADLKKQFYETYQPPEGKVLTGFSIDFGCYTWPRPEAIRRYCPFEGREQLPKDPINEHQLINMLYQIKHCPCAKTQFYDRISKLYIKQLSLLKQFSRWFIISCVLIQIKFKLYTLSCCVIPITSLLLLLKGRPSAIFIIQVTRPQLLYLGHQH